MMKLYAVNAFFPQATAHAANQSVRVRASSYRLAAARALNLLMDRPYVKGKQHKEVKLQILCLGREAAQ